jgi:hypothetical protein
VKPMALTIAGKKSENEYSGTKIPIYALQTVSQPHKSQAYTVLTCTATRSSNP